MSAWTPVQKKELYVFEDTLAGWDSTRTKEVYQSIEQQLRDLLLNPENGDVFIKVTVEIKKS